MDTDMNHLKFADSPTTWRVATHQFTSIEGAPFCARSYSRLKFGSNEVAKRFGYEMAESFFQTHGDILRNHPCVVIPAPSTTVSVAATLLSRHFMDRTNSLLSHIDRMPVEWSMIHRNMTYNNNYADLPKEERKKLLAADTIYINRSFVEGKFIIFIDDCTITGTHEEKISEFLLAEGLENDHAFVCFAKYQGDDPSIEMRLNHVEIRDAVDLVSLSWEPGHEVTTRSLRLLLEHPAEDFERLLANAPPAFVEASYHASIVKGYNRHAPYLSNFNTLARFFGMGRPLAPA
jgi:hypothetical protein